MKQRKWIRIGIEIPVQISALVVPGEHSLSERRKIERHDVELHADLLQLRLEQRRELRGSRTAADDQHLDLQRLLVLVQDAVAIRIQPSKRAQDALRFLGVV